MPAETYVSGKETTTKVYPHMVPPGPRLKPLSFLSVEDVPSSGRMIFWKGEVQCPAEANKATLLRAIDELNKGSLDFIG